MVHTQPVSNDDLDIASINNDEVNSMSESGTVEVEIPEENSKTSLPKELLFIVDKERTPEQFRRATRMTGIVTLSSGVILSLATAIATGASEDYGNKTKLTSYLPLQNYDLLFILGTGLITIGSSSLIISSIYYPTTMADVKKFTRTQFITGLTTSLTGLTVLGVGIGVWNSQSYRDMDVTSGLLTGMGASILFFGLPSLLLGIFGN